MGDWKWIGQVERQAGGEEVDHGAKITFVLEEVQMPPLPGLRMLNPAAGWTTHTLSYGVEAALGHPFRVDGEEGGRFQGRGPWLWSSAPLGRGRRRWIMSYTAHHSPLGRKRNLQVHVD